MLKSVEMKRELADLMNQMKVLNDLGEIQKAHDMLSKVKEIQNKIEVQETLEAEPKNKGGFAPINQTAQKEDPKKVRNRVFNKQVTGKALNDNEIEFAAALIGNNGEVLNAAGSPGQVGVTPAKGGYLLPEEQMQRVIEFRRSNKSLKALCQVIPVSTRTGKMPTLTDGADKLTNFDELNEITKSDIDFGQVTFSIATYGDIIPVANELLDDTDIDLIGIIGARFSKKAVRTENEKIVALMKELSPTTITDYKGIKTAYNKTLDPAIGADAIIITNQDGFDWLDQQEDDTGRPLLQPNPADKTQMLFGGHRVEVFSNKEIPTDATNIPFFVGSLAQYCAFFDRKTVEIAASTEAGFTSNSTMLRAIERFDVKKLDDKALVMLQVTVGA